MLKTLIQTILIVSTLAFIGCGNKSSSSNNNSTSTTCFTNPTTGGCDNSVYNNYYAYGYQAYPYGYSYNSNSIFRYQTNYYSGYGSALCSCPSGSRPVYNGAMGTGCLAQSQIPNYVPVYYWSFTANYTANNQYVNMPQMSNINGGMSNGGCYNNVAWTCQVGQTNQCPSGSVCTSTVSNSPIGLCVRQ
jgi:hypothetical protein